MVLTKHCKASKGVFTIGSPRTLNDVLIKIGKAISMPLIDRLHIQNKEVNLMGLDSFNECITKYTELLIQQVKRQHGIGIISYAQPFKSIFNLSINTINVIWKPSKELCVAG